MIRLFKIESRFGGVAGGAQNLLVSFYQFALIEDVFPILIKMMTVLAIQSLFHMELVGKIYRGSFFPHPAF